ncbi:accessory gene regulator ArgB-like protein [Paenibacillus rhizophilus]|nr:accessory gene regulator B family protein [Paenibacillus rhizophilus]
MNTLSYKVAFAIKQANPEGTSSIEVMQYSLSILFNTACIIISSLVIGWLTGQWKGTILTLFSIALLRFVSGGVHLKSAKACNIASILTCTIIPHLSSFLDNYILLINGVSLVIMAISAPKPDKNAQLPIKWFPFMKVIAMLLVLSNFFIGSSVIGLAFFVQSLTVIYWKRRVLL